MGGVEDGTEGDSAMDETRKMMEELDKDKDGFLSFKEFLGDDIDGAEEAEDEMKKSMQEDFAKADKNKDAKLSAEELLLAATEELQAYAQGRDDELSSEEA